jgi:hypothetical protein
MAISDNIVNVKRKILKDLSEGTLVFTSEVQGKAMKAILAGFGHNQACEQYMDLFSTSPAEMARLMGDDGSTGVGHEGKDQGRAYLMAAGTCGPDTVLNFDKGVSKLLDL